MSINACTINSATINALCGSRRAAIIETLRPAPVVQGVKSHPYHSRMNYTRDEQIDPRTIESVIVGVQVEMNGERQIQTVEMKNDIIPMLSISKFTCDTNIEESVNISNITVKAI